MWLFRPATLKFAKKARQSIKSCYPSRLQLPQCHMHVVFVQISLRYSLEADSAHVTDVKP